MFLLLLLEDSVQVWGLGWGRIYTLRNELLVFINSIVIGLALERADLVACAGPC